MNSKEEKIEALKPGDFFGEEVLFPEVTTDFQFKATKPSVVYFIDESSLLEIPIVYLKLLEILTKRTRILERLQ
jgi:CRP-like cAMP-binding protein